MVIKNCAETDFQVAHRAHHPGAKTDMHHRIASAPVPVIIQEKALKKLPAAFESCS